MSASTASEPLPGVRAALFGPLDNATRRRFGLPEEQGGRFGQPIPPRPRAG